MRRGGGGAVAAAVIGGGGVGCWRTTVFLGYVMVMYDGAFGVGV